MYGDPWTRGAAPHTATKLITAPIIEPYTLEEAKSHCRIVTRMTMPACAEWIRAARTKVEKDTGRALLTQTWDLFLDAFYCGGPYLGDFGWPRYARPSDPGAVSAAAVGDLGEPDGHQQQRNRLGVEQLRRRHRQRSRAHRVVGYRLVAHRVASFQPGRVRFVAGWTSAEEIPDSLRQAVALQIGWFSENREPKAIERDAYEHLIAPFSVFSAV
jgi:hypothetical protein